MMEHLIVYNFQCDENLLPAAVSAEQKFDAEISKVHLYFDSLLLSFIFFRLFDMKCSILVTVSYVKCLVFRLDSSLLCFLTVKCPSRCRICVTFRNIDYQDLLSCYRKLTA